MLLVYSGMFSAALWVLLWGLDFKALDALMISLLLLVLAAVAHIVAPLAPGRAAAPDEHPDPAPFN